MNFETRLALDQDILRIAEITEEHDSKGIDLYIKAFQDQINQNKEENSYALIFVTLLEGKVVGHGKLFKYCCEEMAVDFKSPEGWYLNGIIVDPAFRRKGVAKELLKNRENFISQYNEKNNLYSIVSAENKPSIKYHESLGFKEHSRAPGFLKIKLNCGEGILFHKVICSTL
jgi:ribosomal protein S18 acetylase RimI-like enzyme